MSRLLLPFCLVLFACKTDPIKLTDDTAGIDETDTDTDTDADTDADTDTDTDTDVACTATITSLSPADGATDVLPNSTVVASFSAAVTAAEITVDSGVTGSVTVADDGLSAIFTADAPFTGGATYTADATVCDSSASSTFTIASPPDVDGLAGRTYVVSLADANFVEPAGIGAVLSAYLTTELLVGVQAASDTSIDMLGAIAVTDSNPPEQEFCLETIPFPTADYTGAPAFTVGPADVTLSLAGYDVTISDFTMSGTFASDSSKFTDGVVSGLLDTRGLGALIGSSDPGAICSLASSFGASCEACPDGADYCLAVLANDITADEVSGLTLYPVAGSDCDACAGWTPATVPAVADQVCPG